MTAPSALDLLAEIRRVGGSLQPNPDGTLGVDLPKPDVPRLVPLIRQRKADLLMLLRPLKMPCLACGGAYRWQDSAGAWHCGNCEPDPRAHILRGVDGASLGNRAITLQPPAGDLPAPGSWAKTPTGEVAELVLYREDGGEVLMRTLKGERLAWYVPEALSWELDWPWADPAPASAMPAPVARKAERIQ